MAIDDFSERFRSFPFLSSGGQSDSLRCSNRFLLPFGGLPRLGLWEGVLGHIAVPVSGASVDGAFLNLVDFGSAPGRRTGNLGFLTSQSGGIDELLGDVLVALALGHLPLHRVDELAVAVNLVFSSRKSSCLPFYGFPIWSVVTSGAKAASRVYFVIMA